MEDDATGVTLGVEVIPTPSSALAPSSSTLDGISDAVSISDAEKPSDHVAQEQGSTGPQAHTDSLSLLPGLLIDQYSVPEFQYGRPVRQTFCGHYLCTLGHGVAV